MEGGGGGGDTEDLERERDGYGRVIHLGHCPSLKGCRWMTYHLPVHTVIMHMNKKTNKLTTSCLKQVLKMTVCLN